VKKNSIGKSTSESFIWKCISNLIKFYYLELLSIAKVMDYLELFQIEYINILTN
jgi:hypothetical protein